MRIRRLFVVFGLIICNAIVFANDSLPPAPFAPLEIIKHKHLSIEYANISIQEKEAKIVFGVRNYSKRAIKSDMKFVLPRFKWEGMSNDYYDRDFPELMIDVANKRIIPRRIADAYVKDKLVTNELLKYNIDPMLVAQADMSEKTIKGINDSTVDELIKKGIFAKSDSSWNENWQLQVTYKWSQIFKENSLTEISYQYKLRPGFDIWNANIHENGDERLQNLLEKYCTSYGKLMTAMAVKGLATQYFLDNEFVIPLSVLPVKKINMEFIPAFNNSSWMPFATASCDAQSNITGDNNLFIHIKDKNVKLLKFISVFFQPLTQE